ncbi:hypothetical protein [Nitrospirillum amazonense]|uniref:hypothetical protein n=1 Tax=Nitrospirillum amazonense TaxID=28077 RepID=UPI0024124CD6|nr:hypothetical protein [Nitrospirillum amazonense]MDG3444544.1 hypothetical protein [Nitrospirillum amazonense]
MLSTIFLAPTAVALAQTSNMKAGQDFGQSMTGTAAGMVTNSTAGNVPNSGGDTSAQQAYTTGNMYDSATAAAQTDEAAQLIGTSFPERSKQPVSPDDAFLSTYWGIQSSPGSVLPTFSGQYGDCSTAAGGQAPASPQTTTCDDSVTLVDNYCTKTRDVEVAAYPVYACTVSSPTLPQQCRVVRNVQVAQNDEYSCTHSGLKSPTTCVVGVDVEVQANREYGCDKKRDYVSKTCDKYLVPGSCATMGWVQYASTSGTSQIWAVTCDESNNCTYQNNADITYTVDGSQQTQVTVTLRDAKYSTKAEVDISTENNQYSDVVQVGQSITHQVSGSNLEVWVSLGEDGNPDKQVSADVTMSHYQCTSYSPAYWVDECQNLQ